VITKTLVTNGAKVFITARKANELNDAVKLLNGIAPGSAVGIQGDVSTDAECKRIVSEVAKHTGKVHALFNNAGITWGGSMEEYQEQAWNKVNSVNVAAIFHLTRAFIPLLEAAATKDETAKVINVASIAGLSTSKFDNAYAYAASKAAVLILTRTLAVQLSDKGISVNAICPVSFIRSFLIVQLNFIFFLQGVFPSKMSKYFTDDDTRREFALATIPLGKHKCILL